MTKQLKEIIKSLPQKPGVYIFKNKKKEILYIGKAINLKKRIKSHFSNSKKDTTQPITRFYSSVKNIDFIETKSEKNALILERKMVKQYSPKYNVELKDDKDFTYVAITKEAMPKIILQHGTKRKKIEADFIGPFVSGKEIKKFLENIRKIIPYRTCQNNINKPCLYHEIGQCWAHGEKSKKYHLVVENLKVMLHLYAQDWNQHRQTKIQHAISQVLGKNKPLLIPHKSALINQQLSAPSLECYDISNTNGSLSVGSMVSFLGQKPNKKMYRKFKIKTVIGADDPKSIKEIIIRRLSHKEWPLPDLIIVDGGKSQLSQLKNINLPIIGLAKTNARNTIKKRLKNDGFIYSQFNSYPLKLSYLPKEIKNTLLRLRDEAHRFAITYHRKIRRLNLN